MKIKTLPAEFTPARPILQQIEQAGFEAYFVGGCVRDTILGLPIHDIDIATSAYPAEIKQIFNRTVDTGIEHGTVMILDHGTGYETTTFRTESGYQDFRRPDSVTFVRSLKEDLKRRDFTINALALKEDGEIVDLFDGLGDLKRHLIRAVGEPAERFHEDALRMMRAARFAAKLDFKIDPATLAGISENAPLLKKIAVERIQVEFEKLMLATAASKGLNVMLETDLYRYCPGLDGNWQHLSNLASTNLAMLVNSAQVWGALTYHLRMKYKQLAPFLKKWKLSNDLITVVQHQLPLLNQIMGDQVSTRDLFKAGQEAVTNAAIIAKSCGANLDLVKLERAYQDLPIKTSRELAINGGDLINKLGVKPGPVMGKIINHLVDMVVDGAIANEPDLLMDETAKFIAQ